jgi:hypothetical protein
VEGLPELQLDEKGLRPLRNRGTGDPTMADI